MRLVVTLSREAAVRAGRLQMLQCPWAVCVLYLRVLSLAIAIIQLSLQINEIALHVDNLL
jgi:hypothetical protein